MPCCWWECQSTEGRHPWTLLLLHLDERRRIGCGARRNMMLEACPLGTVLWTPESNWGKGKARRRRSDKTQVHGTKCIAMRTECSCIRQCMNTEVDCSRPIPAPLGCSSPN